MSLCKVVFLVVLVVWGGGVVVEDVRDGFTLELGSVLG